MNGLVFEKGCINLIDLSLVNFVFVLS